MHEQPPAVSQGAPGPQQYCPHVGPLVALLAPLPTTGGPVTDWHVPESALPDGEVDPGEDEEEEEDEDEDEE